MAHRNAMKEQSKSEEELFRKLALEKARHDLPEWKREEYEKWSWLRQTLDTALQRGEWMVGLVVLANLACIAREADLNASGQGKPDWLKTTNRVFVAFYVVELCMRLYVERRHFFGTAWNNLDFLIVIVGVVGEVLEGALESVSAIRTLRILRMMRIVRVLESFKELWALIRDMLDCMRTLFWAFVLMAVSLTVCAIFCVELLNDLVVDVAEDGSFANCDWCSDAFSSVLQADLTLFAIVSGDGWSILARPLIQKHPAIALVFLLIIFTFCFGFLNIIVAVMVENASAGRDSDIQRKAKLREELKGEGKVKFMQLCQKIDVDHSGNISQEEITKASVEIPEFRDILQAMDIGDQEIECVFALLDEDESGSVEYDEFAEQLWKMKSQETHTTLMIVKYYTLKLWQKLGHNTKSLEEQIKRMDEMKEQSNRMTTTMKFSELTRMASPDDLEKIQSFIASFGHSELNLVNVELERERRCTSIENEHVGSYSEHVPVDQHQYPSHNSNRRADQKGPNKPTFLRPRSFCRESNLPETSQSPGFASVGTPVGASVSAHLCSTQDVRSQTASCNLSL